MPAAIAAAPTPAATAACLVGSDVAAVAAVGGVV